MKKILITLIAISTLTGHVQAQHYENNDYKIVSSGSALPQSSFQLSAKSKSNKFVIRDPDSKKLQVEIWNELQKNKDSLTYSTYQKFDVKNSYKLDIATDLKPNGDLLLVITRPGVTTSALYPPKDGCQIKYYAFNQSEPTEKSRVPLLLIYYVKKNDTATEKAVNAFLESTNLKSNEEEAITKKILSISGIEVTLLSYTLYPISDKK
jgi:hypothetical protein